MKDYFAFTYRELDVLRLMAQGLDNKEIAKTLFVAVTTVKTFINRIYQKLGFTDPIGQVPRVCAVLYYIEHKEELERWNIIKRALQALSWK